MGRVGGMLCPQNLTLTILRLNPDLGCEKLVTNRLICNTVNILYIGRDNYSGV